MSHTHACLFVKCDQPNAVYFSDWFDRHFIDYISSAIWLNTADEVSRERLFYSLKRYTFTDKNLSICEFGTHVFF